MTVSSMEFPSRFDGKVLMLTGSAAAYEGELLGFGGATAWRFLREGGAGVLLTDVRDEQGERSAEQMRDAGFGAEYVRLDVTDGGEWQAAIDRASSAFGRLDYLANIAGILDPTTIDETPVERWQAVMDVTNRGMFLGVKLGARAMRETGGGAIVNLASMAARMTGSYGAAYGASRAGMTHFTRACAVQYGALGIGVNCVLPGWVKSPFTKWIFEDEESSAWREGRVPLGRWGEPEEIAAAILFLLSDDASYINGSELLVDGGTTAGTPKPVPHQD